MVSPSQTRHTTTADLIVEGRDALLAGDKVRARALLERAVEGAPDSVEAWLWLSGTHTAPDEMARCLRQVLAIDPDNQQALEGLAWLAETYGLVSERPTAEPRLPTTEARSSRSPGSRVEKGAVGWEATGGARRETGSLQLLESALHVVGVGALLGLLRLTATLRPGTLLLLRGSEGPIGLAASLGLAAVAALLHGLALLFTWGVLSRSISSMRHDRRGDHFDSLVCTGQAFVPGYLVSAALLAAAMGLGWSDRRWLPVVLMVWGLVIASAALIARRVARLLDLGRVPRAQRAVRMARIAIPALLVALLGLGLAGIVVQALLRVL